MALAAPVGIVQLNDASQRLGIIALDHGLHQFVLDQPGGVGVDAQLPVQAQGRDAVLVPWGLPLVVLGQQVDRQEPDAQRHVGVGARELGAGGQRGLMLAAIALEHRATAQLAVAGMPAVRAAEPARPAHAHQGLAALGFGAVAFEEGRQAHAGLKLDGILGHGATLAGSGGCTLRPARIKGCDKWVIRTTLDECLRRYIAEYVPRKRDPDRERSHVDAVRATPLAKLAMARVRSVDVARLRNAWAATGHAPATIVRRLAVLSHVFNVARREWGMESISNPVEFVTKPTVRNARTCRVSNRDIEPSAQPPALLNSRPSFALLSRQRCAAANCASCAGSTSI